MQYWPILRSSAWIQTREVKSDAWQNLARAYFDNGDYQLSLACVRRYHTLGYLMPQEFLLQLKAKM